MSKCINICKQYQAKGRAPNLGRYAHGQKRCQCCDVYLIYEGIFCPCCRGRLRTKPRNKVYKAKLRAKLLVSSQQHLKETLTSQAT